MADFDFSIRSITVYLFIEIFFQHHRLWQLLGNTVLIYLKLRNWLCLVHLHLAHVCQSCVV